MPTPQPKQQDTGIGVSVGEEVPLEATIGQARPNLRPTPMFLLYWSPGVGAFSVRRLSDGTPVLVPRIQMLSGRPGINGVAGGDGQDLDFRIPAAAITKRGGVILDGPTMRRAGMGSYLRRHKLARRDGKGNDTYAHTPPWVRPVRKIGRAHV